MAERCYLSTTRKWERGGTPCSFITLAHNFVFFRWLPSWGPGDLSREYWPVRVCERGAACLVVAKALLLLCLLVLRVLPPLQPLTLPTPQSPTHSLSLKPTHTHTHKERELHCIRHLNIFPVEAHKDTLLNRLCGGWGTGLSTRGKPWGERN